MDPTEKIARAITDALTPGIIAYVMEDFRRQGMCLVFRADLDVALEMLDRIIDGSPNNPGNDQIKEAVKRLRHNANEFTEPTR